MIDILMATYNGEKYLKEQIESILAQTYSDWHLYIQDDCSKDGTAEIVKEYVNKYPEKISFFQRETPSGGAKENFMDMLKYVKSDYIMFSDQDDVWLPEKVEITHQKMISAESEYGNNEPILINTDLTVTDEKLDIVGSFFSINHNCRASYNWKAILLCCPVTGCTMEMNKALFNIIYGKSYSDSVMHDYWIALIASVFGTIQTVSKPTILYRQHGNNVYGADTRSSLEKICGVFIRFTKSKREEAKKEFTKQYNQTVLFCEQYRNMLTDEQVKTLEKLIAIRKKKQPFKMIALFLNGFTHPWLKQTIFFWLFY